MKCPEDFQGVTIMEDLSDAALAFLRRRLDGERIAVDEFSRQVYRELAAAGLMIGGPRLELPSSPTITHSPKHLPRRLTDRQLLVRVTTQCRFLMAAELSFLCIARTPRACDSAAVRVRQGSRASSP